MTEFVDRVNLEDLDFDDERIVRNDDMFTPSKLMGVAIFGAVAALAGYYVYASLDSEKRSALRDCVISAAKEQVSALTATSK